MLALVVGFIITPAIALRSSNVHIKPSKFSLNDAPNYPGYTGPETTPILDTIAFPSMMKKLDTKQLKQLAHELRWETINAVSKVGGHLGSSLGVVELTVALHYVFDAPVDKIVWDVAHQSYPHKILTGRRHKMHTLRQLHGLAGFTNRKESPYDCFGAGHSSTSISAALGMSVGKNLLNQPSNNCVAVIGDGAITGGMAYEAMNNAAYINSKVTLVIPTLPPDLMHVCRSSWYSMTMDKCHSRQDSLLLEEFYLLVHSPDTLADCSHLPPLKLSETLPKVSSPPHVPCCLYHIIHCMSAIPVNLPLHPLLIKRFWSF